MKKLLSLLMLAPFCGMGQGIHFESGLNWQQILEKARTENKYVFVDCYASWCGPCKMMDRNVYSNDSLGQVMDAHFISVKVQMDQTGNDDQETKAWYADAHKLMVDYKIGAYPSFLFFSPDGKIVHRGRGYKDLADFGWLAAEAQDPKKQYYTLLAAYQAGQRNLSVVPYLLSCANAIHDHGVATSLSTAYLHGYLDKLNDEELCTKANLEFLPRIVETLSSKDRVFEWLYRHSGLADSTMHDKDYAKRILNDIASKEEIVPVVNAAIHARLEPNWDSIGNNIKNKYSRSCAEETVVDTRVRYYKATREWKNYAKYLVIQMDRQDLKHLPSNIFAAMMLNNNSWDVFQYSDNQAELEKALAWSDLAIHMQTNPNPGFLDTKANLLYKLGKKDEAISLETEVSKRDPKDFADNLEKMQHGAKTWVF